MPRMSRFGTAAAADPGTGAACRCGSTGVIRAAPQFSLAPMREPGEARLLASGVLLQQVAQGSGLLALLVIVTLLARRVDVPELAAYGLISTLSGYMLVLKNSASNSA